MTLTELALRRAGFTTLAAFQRANALEPSDVLDVQTTARLLPYLLGYLQTEIRPGDSFYRFSQQYEVALPQILAANPGKDPDNLTIGEKVVIPLNFEVVPTDVSFDSELLGACLRGLQARYPFLQVERIATTDYGRGVNCVRIGSGTRVVSYNASHHANEWITTPVLLHFLEEYAKAYVMEQEIFGYPARQLYESTTLYLVPMVNPDGVDLVTGAISPESFAYKQARNLAANYPQIPFPDGWKANLNGVDLNLNYPAGWEQARQIKYEQGYDLPGPRDFVGLAPLDQPETAGMAALTQRIEPALTISYHTQGGQIFWKFQDIEPEGAKALGERFAEVSGYTLEEVPYASGFAGYKDWFLLVFNRPGYTIEAGLGQNPLPISQFEQIYRDNLGILTLGLIG